MNIDITRLKSGIDSQVEIDMLYSFDKEMLKKTDIISLDNISVKGYITSNIVSEKNYELSLLFDKMINSYYKDKYTNPCKFLVMYNNKRLYI